ncbi:MAG: hypothetical protein CK426_04940 [Legionella sp.]|nr:MAG: hypothetical protein CK423_01430 [Legionella sp.]PJD98705.1 MAG: hypothetical protein CK426_04940 [Legionella sp.]
MKIYSYRLLVNTCVIILFIIQIGVRFIAYSETQNLVGSFKWATHTNEVLYAIHDLWLNEIEIENEVHDYLLMRNINDMKKAKEKMQLIKGKLDRLQLLVADNRQQSNNVKLMIPLFLNQQQQFIEFMDANNNENLQLVIKSLRQSSFASALVSIMQSMISNERSLLEERKQTVYKRNLISNVYFTITITLNALFLILFLIIFNLQYSKAISYNRRIRTTESRLKGIIQGTTDLIAAIDTDYRLIVMNQAFEQQYLSRYGKPVALGDNIKEYILALPNSQQILLDYLNKALQGEVFQAVHNVVVDSQKKHYEITFNPIYDKEQKLIGVVLISRDITEHLQLENNMQEANKNLAIAIQKMKEKNLYISSLNLLGSTLQSCLTIEEMYAPIATYAPKILLDTAGIVYITHPSRNYMDLGVSWNSPQLQEKIISPEHCWALRRGQLHVFYNRESSVSCDHLKGVVNPPASICIPLQAQNDIVGLMYIEFITVANQTEKEFNEVVKEYSLLVHSFAEAIALSLSNIRLRDTLHRRSIRDSLTGMYNRSYLDESLDREIYRARRQHANMAVVMVDIDYFKKINDSFGHEAGDMVLIKIANIILSNLRQSDIACRYGGDEILLLLFEINTEEVVKRINELRELISKTEFLHHGKLLGKITASFGIACLSEYGSVPKDLIREADEALYLSKKNGRNLVTLAQAKQ